MEFRGDIQGLRAIAVVVVLLFHFGIGGVGGGFVGVDVFFVLSGYLMTAIIVSNIQQGRFSLPRFYLARARRILPALGVLCLVLLVLGWFLLPPSDYQQLGKHATAAIAFASNFTFRDEAGYFDTPSQTKLLLHSWSLAAEWQFYLIYPLLLIVLQRWIRQYPQRFLTTIWALAALSFAASVWLTVRDPASAFYLLPTRAWEMLAGGLVFLHAAQRRPAHPVFWEAAGITAILVAAFWFRAEMLWPGYAALLPVMGTVLVLLAHRPDSWLTGNRLAQALGRWSYSLYLWHWPLAVTLVFLMRQNDPLWIAGALLLTLALGAASYRYVEQPARRFSLSPWPRAALMTILAMGIVAALGAMIDKGDGLPSRVAAEVTRIDAEAQNHFKGAPGPCGFNRDTRTLVPCDLDAEEGIRWVVMGDSHAGSVLGAIREALPGGIRYYIHQCSTLFNAEIKTKGQENGCTPFMQQAWEQIQQLPDDVTIIVLNRYAVNLKGPNEATSKPFGYIYTDLGHEQATMDPFALYHDRLVDTLCTMRAKRRVVAVLPIPEIGVDVPMLLARHAMWFGTAPPITVPRETYQLRNAEPIAALQDAAGQCGVQLLNPAPYLCTAAECYGARNGAVYYTDDDHLSETGNRLLVPLFSSLH